MTASEPPGRPLASVRFALDDLLGELLRQTREIVGVRDGLWRLVEAIIGVATAQLSLASVLARVVDVAGDMVDAEYAALGVVGPSGELREFVHAGMDAETVERIGHFPEGHGILGLLITEPQLLRLDRLSDHPAAVGFPEHHPPMTSFLGVPIEIEGQVYGNLYLTNKRGGPFSEEDCELVTTLSAAAGVAIDNARRHEATVEHERWLQATHDLFTSVLAGGDLREIHRHVLFSARLLTGSAASALITDDGGALRVVAAHGAHADDLRGRVLKPDESLAARVAASSAAAAADDAGDADDALLAPLGAFGGALAAPLRALDRELGVLLVAREKGRAAYAPDQLEALERFAAQSALALDYGHAVDQRRRADLFAERERIGHDLHDLVIQRLFATGLELESLGAQLAHDHDSADRLNTAVEQIDAAIADLRSSIFSLHARREGVSSLISQLEDICADADAVLGFTPGCDIDPLIEVEIPDEVVHHVLATVRELLSNVARHAGASRVSVRLRVIDHSLHLEVVDDGRGMTDPVKRSGLANLLARAERLGGAMEIGSAPSGGTHIAWRVPLR